jgi:hypothetical protein
MFLNSEVQAALDGAKAKINEHTRHAATELAACNDALVAARHLWEQRRESIAMRRAQLDEEWRESNATFDRNLSEVLTRITTVSLGMRDGNQQEGETKDEKPEGENVTTLPGKRKSA